MFKNLFNKIKEIYLKFQIEISLMTIYAVYLIAENHNILKSYNGVHNISKFVFYTFFLLVGFRYIFTSKIKHICSAVGLSLIFMFLSGTRGLNTELSEINVIRSLLFGVLCFFLMIIIPFIKGRKDEKIDNYNLFLFKNLSLTVIVANILNSGLMMIILLVSYLFREPNHKIYLDIMVFSYLIFTTFFMLSFYPDKIENLEKDNTKVLKFLFLFVAVPLLAIYTLVVYSYFFKILIKMSIPKGEISQLILIHGIITIIVILLIKGSSLINDSVKRKIEKVFCITELPMILMLFIAIFQRTKQYGMTINRYAVIIFGLYLLFIVLYILLFKKNKTFIIMGSFMIVLFFSIVGPLNIFKIPFYFQEKRLERILKQNSIDKNGKSEKAVDEKIKKDIKSIFSYFDKWENNSLGKKYNYDKLYENLGLGEVSSSERENTMYYSFSVQGPLNVKDYDILLRSYSSIEEEQYKNYKFKNSKESIIIYRGDTKILDFKRKDIEKEMTELIKNGKSSEHIELTNTNGEVISSEKYTKELFAEGYSNLGVKYSFENEDLKISFLISSFGLQSNEEPDMWIETILIKFKKDN